jgi:hypothetical protein
MSALMGGPQPTASDMPADYFPPAPSQGGGIDMMQAQELLGNEFLPQGRRAALEALVASEQQRQQMAQEQQMKQSDPAYQLGLQKTQLELQQMQQPKPGFKTLTDDEEKTMGLDPAGIYQQGPDNKLVVVREPPKAPEQPTNIREYEYAVKQARDAGVPADQIPSYDAWSVSQKKAGAQNINVGGGENKQVFDAVAASADTARSTVAGLNSLREAKKAVEGGIISGAGADTMLGLQKIGAALGVADPNVIVNTETFRSAIAPQVAAVMKATVGSANISNTDREFAEKAAGGNINLDEGTIRRLLDIMERASTASVNAHIDRLNRVYPDGKGFDRERALFGVDLPQPEPAAQPAPAAPQAAPAGEPSIDDLLKMYGK